MLTLASLVLLLVGLASSQTPLQLYGSKITGTITFYGAGADSGGTCMYNNPTFNLGLPTVAIGDFQNSAKCGMCVMIYPLGTGTGNSDFPTRAPFMAFVNNQCSECGTTNLDLAQTGDGIWDIQWEAVDCPVSGEIALQLKTGSTVYYTEISARNFRNAIASIEFNIGGTWTALTRQSYNYFLYSSTVTLPVQARLTSVFGQTQITTLTQSVYNVIEPGLTTSTLQFPSSAPATTPTKAPTTPTKAPTTPTKAPTTPTKAPTTPTKAPTTPTKTPTKAPTTPTKTPTKAASIEMQDTVPSSTGTGNLSTPVIIGIFVGCTLLVVIVVFVVVFRLLKKRTVETF